MVEEIQYFQEPCYYSCWLLLLCMKTCEFGVSVTGNKFKERKWWWYWDENLPSHVRNGDKGWKYTIIMFIYVEWCVTHWSLPMVWKDREPKGSSVVIFDWNMQVSLYWENIVFEQTVHETCCEILVDYISLSIYRKKLRDIPEILRNMSWIHHWFPLIYMLQR